VPVSLASSVPARRDRKRTLPLLRPVIATAAILVTIFEWNDVFYSFFVLGGSSATTLPLIVVFVVGQRRIVSGLTSGAIK
jgi:raffinose/stachyose/melibiose transport system permease protein